MRSSIRVATLDETLRYSRPGLDRRRLLPAIAGGAGLGIDSSTPAYVSTTTGFATSLTTASFTPPLGALLVVAFANANTTSLQTVPTNTGGAITWNGSAKVTEAANSCSSSIWFGTVTTSASLTVTGHVASASDWGIGVVVVTGQSATQNGATQVASSASGTPSGTIASLIGSSSLVLGSIANFSNATVGTPGTNQSLSFNGHTYSMTDATSGSAIWAQSDTRISLAAGTSDIINDTAPTAIDYSLTMCEIIAASGGPSFLTYRIPLGV